MLKIGAFAFGGGYAIIALLENEFVTKRGWIDHDEFMNVVAIAESTPGPIAINCATFVGYQQAGLAGSLLATVGIVLPSFALIYLISLFLDNFLEIPLIVRAFRGIRIAVGLLILDAAVTMIRKMPKKRLPRIIMLAAFAAMLTITFLSLNISSIALMLSAAAVSLTVFAAGKGGDRK